jgi:hypothetical protein
MPDLSFEQVLGLAAVITIITGSLAIWDRFRTRTGTGTRTGTRIGAESGTRLIVQCWWELVLDPVKRKRFRKSLLVGLALREVPHAYHRRRRWETHLRRIRENNQGEMWRDLIEPAHPFSLRHVGADGVWALRVLIYNPSRAKVEADQVERIDFTIPGQPGINPMSWQFQHDRLDYERTDNRRSGGYTYSIRLPAGLPPGRKIREELVVAFDSQSRPHQEPPTVEVQVHSSVKSKTKLYRPSLTKLEALGQGSLRFVVSVLRRLGIVRD